MKTALLYGFLLALGTALLTLALYFFDFHSDVEKLSLAQTIGSIGGIGLCSACLYFGMSESRANAAAARNDWFFGSAFGQGLAISLCGAVLAAGFNYFYFTSINPDFGSVIQRAQLAAMEAKGMPAEQIERAAQFTQRFFSPAALTIFGGVFGFLVNAVIALHFALAMPGRHPRASLLRTYAIIGAPLGLLVGLSQGSQHGHALAGAAIGLIAGPLAEMGIAALVLALSKYARLAVKDDELAPSDAPPRLP